MALRTPLYDRHVDLGARMVEFGGWDMPLQYSSMREEHQAVRQRAGLFDVSHMGRLMVGGPGALESLQRLMTNDVARLQQPLESLYTVMCNDEGGIIDDLIVITGLSGSYYIVVNAATRDKDVAWMRGHLPDDVGFTDITDSTSLLALQGPRAQTVLQTLVDADLSGLRPFRLAKVALTGIDAKGTFVSRTGYTGEDGFEIIVDATRVAQLWDRILEAGASEGVRPCGLGARDTLRLEAGLRLYGQDMDESVDPFSVALGWVVKLDKGVDCHGADALRRIRQSGPRRRFVGLRLAPRDIARHGMAVLQDGVPVGEVTSGTFSFSLGCSIATAFVTPAVAESGVPLHVDIRGTLAVAEQVPLPFYKRPRPSVARGD